MKRQKVIITAAVVGTAHMASMSPYFPVKPEDIIQQAVDACAAVSVTITFTPPPIAAPPAATASAVVHTHASFRALASTATSPCACTLELPPIPAVT